MFWLFFMYNKTRGEHMKKVLVLIGILLLLTGCMSEENKELTKTTMIVPTMSDKVGENGLWVGTFQLVWNDVKNELIKQDIQRIYYK